MILLIHGYGISVKSYFQRPKKFGGFYAFEKLIQAGKAKTFLWDEKHNLNTFQSVNPFKQLSIYANDRKKATSEEIQKKLQQSLQDTQPTTVIVHSLGGHLLLHYLEKYGLPDSVTSVVFLHVDVPHNFTVTNPNILQRLRGGSLKWQNIYSPFDFMLWLSSIYHLTFRAGLIGSRELSITNSFFWSFKTAHVHTSCVEDEKILKFLQK
jgi:hypothetical protein